jgi:hypothetical protein
MKKLQVFMLGLFAVFAFGAFAATSAFAETEGELLTEGLTMGATEERELEATGELTLKDEGAAGKPTVDCSGIFKILTLGPLLFDIVALLMLNKELLTPLGLPGTATDGEPDMIDCTSLAVCESEPEALGVLVTVLNLPWHVLIELMLDVNGNNVYLLDFKSNADNEAELVEGAGETNYTIDCLVPLIGLVENTCTGLSSLRLVNGAGGLESFFNQLALTEPTGAESELANCSVGGAKQGLIESVGAGIITDVGGLALTVSE